MLVPGWNTALRREVNDNDISIESSAATNGESIAVEQRTGTIYWKISQGR